MIGVGMRLVLDKEHFDTSPELEHKTNLAVNPELLEYFLTAVSSL